MTNQELQSILGSKIVSFHAIFAKALGNVPAAIILSQSLFWQEKAKHKNEIVIDGEAYFSKTADEWFEETGLSEEQQLTARKLLVACKTLKETRAGMPAKMCFRVDLDALVAVINRYLLTGDKVAVDYRNKKRQYTRTSSGKFRQQEAVKNGSTYKIESKGESLRQGGEEKTERDATPAPLAGANISTTVEAPLDQKNNLAAGGGENAAPGAGPGAAACPMISITDSPKAHTPLELEAAMECFYTQYANEWTSGVLQYARGAQYPVEKQKEIVKEFCCWAVEHNRGGDSYASLNARLQKWFSNEKYSTWKQSAPTSNTSTTIPALRRAGQD